MSLVCLLAVCAVLGVTAEVSASNCAVGSQCAKSRSGGNLLLQVGLQESVEKKQGDPIFSDDKGASADFIGPHDPLSKDEAAVAEFLHGEEEGAAWDDHNPSLMEFGEHTHPLTMSWRIDADSATMLKPAKQLFDEDKLAPSKTSIPDMDTDETESTSSREYGDRVSMSFGVEGSYHAFSGAAQASLDMASSSTYKTYRKDKTIEVSRVSLAPTTYEPAKSLTDDARRFLLDSSVAQILFNFGEFFASEITLGGLLKTTITTEMEEFETSVDVAASLEAGYDNLVASAAASFSLGSQHTSQVSSRRVTTSASALGGETNIWHSATTENFADVQKRWADSFNDENSYPMKFQLRPLWELLEPLDPTKAKLMEKHLKELWAKQNDDFHPTVRSCPSRYFTLTSGSVFKQIDGKVCGKEWDISDTYCEGGCAKVDCLKANGTWVSLNYQDEPYTCAMKPNNCPEGYGPIKKGCAANKVCCGAWWIPSCGESCRKRACSSAGGAYIPHNSKYPYRCEMEFEHSERIRCPNGYFTLTTTSDLATWIQGPVCGKSWDKYCGEGCAKDLCLSATGTWVSLNYRDNYYTCAMKPNNCPEGYGPIKNGGCASDKVCCGAWWTSSCGESCRKRACSSAGGTYIPHNSKYPYRCQM